MKLATGVWAVFLLLSIPASAQDERDSAVVCAVAERHYAAIRAGDFEAVVQQHMPEFTFFTAEGDLLWPFHSLEQQRAELADASFASTTSIRHCSGRIHGDVGVATYYLVGSVTSAGQTRTGTWRVTEVWVKQGDEWKEAHHHESPLLGAAVR